MIVKMHIFREFLPDHEDFVSGTLVAIADLKTIRIKIIFKRISQKYKTRVSHRTYGSSNSNWYVKFQMFMSARAFWRVSYFAVFYKEYLNFSWFNLIEAYIFFNLHLKDH